MTDSYKRLRELIEQTNKILADIRAAMAAPDEAMKALSGAVIGHKGWDGYGLREIRGKDLHERAVAAVTDYLVDDLAKRKSVELKALANELDSLRVEIADVACAARFELIDMVREAREAFKEDRA